FDIRGGILVGSGALPAALFHSIGRDAGLHFVLPPSHCSRDRPHSFSRHSLFVGSDGKRSDGLSGRHRLFTSVRLVALRMSSSDGRSVALVPFKSGGPGLLPDSRLCPSGSDSNRTTDVSDTVPGSSSDCGLRRHRLRMADSFVTASTRRAIHLAQFDSPSPGAGSFLRVVEFCKSLRILSRRGHDELFIAQGALPRRAPVASGSLHVGSQPGHSTYLLSQ